MALVITFIQGIYNYIPETNHVSRAHSVASVLYLEFVLHVMLFLPCSMFCTSASALPQYVCSAQYGCFFCSSLISCSPGMLLKYCLRDFEMVPVAPVVAGITFAFTFHMHCISVVRSLYFRIFAAHLLLLLLLLLLLSLLLVLLMYVQNIWNKQWYALSVCLYASFISSTIGQVSA